MNVFGIGLEVYWAQFEGLQHDCRDISIRSLNGLKARGGRNQPWTGRLARKSRISGP